MDRHVIHTEHAPAAIGPYSQAIRVGNVVYTSGQIGIVPDSGAFVGDGVDAQARQALTNLKHVLEAAGASLSDVVKTTVFLADMSDYTVVNSIYAEFFPNPSPARSAVQAAALPKGARVEVEAIAHL
jgi:2-iminobutanoate/2-iminopropanoate deaminase